MCESYHRATPSKKVRITTGRWAVCSILWVVFSGMVLSGEGVLLKTEYKTSVFDSPLREVTKYSFEAGGSMNLHILVKNMDPELTPNNEVRVHFLVCEEEKYELISQVLLLSEECEPLDTFRKCFHYSKLDATTTHNYNAEITQNGIYHLLMANCDRLKLHITLEGTLINPAGKHLDSNTHPVLFLYPLISACWFTLCVLYIINSLINYRYAQIPLHKLLTFTAFMKGGVSLVHYKYWLFMSQHGSTDTYMTVMYFTSRVLWTMLLYFVLLVISKGWCITRYSLSYNEMTCIVVMILLIGIADGLTNLGDDSLISTLIMITSMKYIFSSMSYNINGLNHQLNLIQEFEIQTNLNEEFNFEQEDSVSLRFQSNLRVTQGRSREGEQGRRRRVDLDIIPITEKLNLFEKMQGLIIMYLFLLLVNVISERYFFSDQVWYMAANVECTDLALLGLGFGYLFRLRDFRQVYNVEGRQHDDSDKPLNKFSDVTEEPKITKKKSTMPPLIIIKNPPTLIGSKGEILSSTNLDASVRFGAIPKATENRPSKIDRLTD